MQFGRVPEAVAATAIVRFTHKRGVRFTDAGLARADEALHTSCVATLGTARQRLVGVVRNALAVGTVCCTSTAHSYTSSVLLCKRAQAKAQKDKDKQTLHGEPEKVLLR